MPRKFEEKFQTFFFFQTKLVVPFTLLWSDGTKTYGKFNGVKYIQGSLKSSTTILSTRK